MIAMLQSVVRVTVTLIAVAVVGACTGPSRLPPAHVTVVPEFQLVPASLPRTLKVVSLNVAHSRSTGFHQLWQSENTAREHLDAVAAMLERENFDIVGLQEVDGPSIWSGNFDHVRYLAEKSGYAQTVRGTHLKAPGLDYGTALMARYPIDDALSAGFSRALTVTQKGFVVSRLQWPGSPGTEVDLVSVHLDPIRPNVRTRQVLELIAVIQERGRPVIVMGDFNSDWYEKESAVRFLGESLNLTSDGADCEDCQTLRRMDRVVDWILVSPEFDFQDFRILDDDISDHYAVAATLILKAPPVLARSAISAALFR